MLIGGAISQERHTDFCTGWEFSLVVFISTISYLEKNYNKHVQMTITVLNSFL